MKVKEIMTTEVGTCTPASDLASVVRVLWDKDCGAVPVVADGKVVGMITDRDICVATATTNQRASEIPVSAVMGPHDTLYACRPDDEIEAVLGLMQNNKVRRLPVTDETGALQGIISISDFVQRAGKSTSTKAQTVAQKEVLTTLKALVARA